jgi:uncharacterized membrane protein YadS
MMYEAQYNAPVALDIATVTKLVRNLCMIAVIPFVGVLFGAERASGESQRIRWLSLIPWFIVGFALMSAVRTLGDMGERPFGILEPEQWADVVQFIRGAAERCLLVAMAAVGLTSMLAGIREIGLRPFALGLFAAAFIGGISFILISLYASRLMQILM